MGAELLSHAAVTLYIHEQNCFLCTKLTVLKRVVFYLLGQKSHLWMCTGRRLIQKKVLLLDAGGGYVRWERFTLPARGGPPTAAIPAKKEAKPK